MLTTIEVDTNPVCKAQKYQFKPLRPTKSWQKIARLNPPLWGDYRLAWATNSDGQNPAYGLKLNSLG